MWPDRAVQHLGCLWRSRGKGACLNFHWKTIVLPVRIAKYVVVHEIARLHERHHTSQFWLPVEQGDADHMPRKNRLAEHGADVERALRLRQELALLDVDGLFWDRKRGAFRRTGQFNYHAVSHGAQ